MAQNVGTLVTAAIRPNDSNDPIASAFAYEIKGGLHTHTTITDRDAIISERREWGMMCYVINDNKTYQLKYNYVDDDIMNNYNWIEFSGSGGSGNEWIDSVLSIEFQPPATYSVGDRYLAGTSQNDSLLGDWSLFNPGVVLEWNSFSWQTTTPTDGMSVRVDDKDNAIYRYEGTFPTGEWVEEKLGQIRSIDASSINGRTYTAETLPEFDDYVRDMMFLTKFDTVNAGATVSININSMGFVDIKKPSSSGLIDLVAGDIIPDITYSLVYSGSVFELIKHYTGDNALNIRYYIELDVHVVVPPYHQYWVYGNLTIDGEMTNYGQVVIANGNLINSSNFYNYGDLYFIQFDAGTGPAGSALSVGDYDTGQTFPNISSIKFRGGSVTTPTGPADSVTVTGNTPNEVIVWIPAPSYTDYFSPTLYNAPYTRYLSNPDSNSWTQSNSPGTFGTGDWNIASNFSSSISRKVLNSNSEIIAFSDTEFACFNTVTTMSFVLYNHDGSVLSEIQNFLIDSNGSTSSNSISINITNFGTDADRYKADVTGKIDVGLLFPNGGRFNWEVTHYNGEGSGNSGAGIYKFTKTDPVFYDAPSNQLNNNSTAKINGTVTFDEDIPDLKYFSGVAFYDIDSTFGVTVSDIDLVNEITFPTTKQIDVIANNMPISDTHDGHSDGSKSSGDLITGWSLDWDISNLTYSVIATVDEAGQYIPGFVNTTTNVISNTAISSMTSNLYDYNLSDTNDSISKLMLFDTLAPTSVSHNNNPINSENGRLSTTGVMANGSAAFNSNSVLAGDELQYIFGRVIFPQTNFNQFLPSANTSVDYGSLSGSNKSFDVYTDTSSTPTTTSVSFNDYRWFVTSYGKDSSYSSSFTNGIFTLNSNFLEEDLHYDSGSAGPGNEDLVLLVGLDSTGTNTTPDKFLFITGNPLTYKGRSTPTSYNLDVISESSKKIQFTVGQIPPSIKKVWLFIGYKNTNRGKNLRITNINLA